MAKFKTKVKNESWKQITTPSIFGSHSSMVVEPDKEEVIPDEMVKCKDDNGFYLTYKNRLDSGLADPCRYSESRRL